MPEVTKAAVSAAEIVCAPVPATRNVMGGTNGSRKPVRSQAGSEEQCSVHRQVAAVAHAADTETVVPYLSHDQAGRIPLGRERPGNRVHRALAVQPGEIPHKPGLADPGWAGDRERADGAAH